MRDAARLGLGLGALLLASACNIDHHVHDSFMAPLQAPAPVVAPADRATVVFLRHANDAYGLGTTVFDDKGRFLGDALAESYFAVNQAPGEHTYFMWKKQLEEHTVWRGVTWGISDSSALRATLAPGHVYYVEVAVKAGFFSPTAELLAVTPRSPQWQEVQAWLKTTTMMRVDLRGGQLFMERRDEGRDLPEQLRMGREALARYDAAQLEARTLRPDDGVLTTAPVLAPSTVAPAQAPVGPGPATAAPMPPPTGPTATSAAATCGDAFEQSQLRRDEGKLLDARKLLRACSRLTCSSTQQTLCSEWLADVEARLPSFVPSARDSAGVELVDVRVLMDGLEVAASINGRAIDVDPGLHSFVFRRSDGTTAETRALAAERGKGRVVSVMFAPSPPRP